MKHIFRSLWYVMTQIFAGDIISSLKTKVPQGQRSKLHTHCYGQEHTFTMKAKKLKTCYRTVLHGETLALCTTKFVLIYYHE